MMKRIRKTMISQKVQARKEKEEEKEEEKEKEKVKAKVRNPRMVKLFDEPEDLVKKSKKDKAI